ncbi:MAG: hypothetical protein OXI30_11740, partial [Chloroflexota bacterium]|nr:hypothetical protein [Chloroflexota bacterium]
DDQWTSGYWAYQNNQCAASQQQSQATATPAQNDTPQVINNCCFVNRQCTNDGEWQSGYRAYQANSQCPTTSQQQQGQAQGQSGDRQQSSSSGWREVRRTNDPKTRSTIIEFESDDHEDNVEIIFREPTDEEKCDAGLQSFCD